MKLLNKTQSGRSMVEMLGVLAIIGVLSVGGIAGYSKAMNKHKINNALDKISHIIARIIELKTSNSLGDGVLTEDLNKVGIECDLVEIDDDWSECSLAFDGTYRMDVLANQEAILAIDFNGNSKAVDFCTSFLTSGIHNNVPDDWWSYGMIEVSSPTSNPRLTYTKNQWDLENNPDAKSELNASDIAASCAGCKTACLITWRLYWQP